MTDSALLSPGGCDQFVADVDPEMAYRVAHDTFPIFTDPDFVPAADADYMRGDDWVVGVRVGATVRCYPSHMLDNVHVVNDTIEGLSYAVMHCEICCSNAVFHATLDGKRLTFGTGGLFGGTLSIFDEQTKSLWSHGMGVAFDGPLAGRGLARVESFQATYAEWVALHPDTEVMVWPTPASHPDPRHGHGTDAWFAQPGIEPLVLKTMSVPCDERLPEHEMVVSVFTPEGNAALPLRDLSCAGGLLAFEVGGHELVALSAGPDSSLAGTFHAHLCDEPEARVSLALRDGAYVDTLTGSVFRADGLAVRGPLAGRWLQPLATMTNKWHSLICFLPDVQIVRGEESAPAEGPLAPVFDALRADGFAVEATRRHFALELPHDAACAFDLLLNGDPFRIVRFAHASSARDQLLWTTHALQEGALLLASAPPLWSDWSNTSRLRSTERAWSPLVDEPALRAALARAAGRVSGHPEDGLASLTDFADALRERGVKVAVRRSSYRETLPVGGRTGMLVHAERDPFIVLRCESAEAAAQGVVLPEHSIVAGHFILQSDPADMYGNLERGTHRRPDEVVSWSKLLRSDEFRAQAADAARTPAGDA